MSDDIATEEELLELEALMAEEDAKEVVEEKKPEAVEKAKETKVASSEVDATEAKPVPKKAASEGTTINPTEIKRDLAFNENTISDAFTGQAGLFFHYAHIAHKLAFDYESKKSQLDILESRIDDEMRKEAASNNSKVTEAQLGKQLKLDPRYEKKVNEVNEARAKAALAKDVLESFKQRRDMLIQMGADLREEFKGQLRMKSSSEDLSERAKDALKNKRA